MRRFVPLAPGVVASMLVLGIVSEALAAVPRGIFLQRRGQTYRMPSKPTVIDSSPTIGALNQALNALGATDREYDGHREKAIAHIGAAIHHLETPNGRGKSNAAIEKAAVGKPAAATRTATTPEAASEASLRKAKSILFSVHHQLTEHAASRGQIHADAEVRIALGEIVAALNPGTTAPAASTTPGKPAR